MCIINCLVEIQIYMYLGNEPLQYCINDSYNVFLVANLEVYFTYYLHIKNQTDSRILSAVIMDLCKYVLVESPYMYIRLVAEF